MEIKWGLVPDMVGIVLMRGLVRDDAVVGAAQGDCAARQSGRVPVQPGNGDICRLLPEPLQSRCCVLRSGGDCSICSRPSSNPSLLHRLASRNSGLIVMPDTFTVAYRVEITSLAARYHLPAIYPVRFFAELGGLLSYGVDLQEGTADLLSAMLFFWNEKVRSAHSKPGGAKRRNVRSSRALSRRTCVFCHIAMVKSRRADSRRLAASFDFSG